jgi:hypothetical protein
VAELPFQANANYGTWSIDFARSRHLYIVDGKIILVIPNLIEFDIEHGLDLSLMFFMEFLSIFKLSLGLLLHI